jgi:Domain of unknown function (DUF6398)
VTKKGRHPKGGRVTPKGTRPSGFRPKNYEPEPEPDLMRDAHDALADPHPLPLLALVSGLLAVPNMRTELVRMFLAIDRRETSGMLAAIAAMSSDTIERRRIADELAERGDLLPAWLTVMGDAEATWTAEANHILRDGENVYLGVRFPTGDELTAVIYVDHNMGTVVKDAFVIAQAAAVAVPSMHSKPDAADLTLAEIAPADARARMAEAIAHGAITYPPFETETWPAARPLVEWMISLLPEGGRGYDIREWTEAERSEIATRFFASPFAAPLGDDEDAPALLDTLLWYGCDYGVCDPRRWSPVRVEILLADWIPRKIVADVPYLAKAPDVLRAFVPFAHGESDIPDRLTAETLAAIDEWEPDFQEIIRSPRLQGAEALAAIAVAAEAARRDSLDDTWARMGEIMLERLEHAVGSRTSLDALDDHPLPDEPFDWSGIADEAHDRVTEVLTLTDRCCDEWFDVEHRTATRRVLARIARGGPETLIRGRVESAAAAICWSVGRVNDSFDADLTVKDLLARFDVKSGITGRAETLLRAGDFPYHSDDFALGSADYLVARRRQTIITDRARFEEWLERDD